MVEEFPFRFSTGLKNIIGKELITDDDIAIFELVKNSYDANAKKVTLDFSDIKASSNAKIFIMDCGQGMSKEDLTYKWLFVGYSEKKPKDKISQDQDYRDKIQQRKRIFAGAKGIGRFSADRLGENLTVYTKKREEKIIHKLEMDWKKFEQDQNKEFQTIKTKYSPIEKLPRHIPISEEFKQGTILEISSLNSKWDYDKLLKLRRYLQRLVNPSYDPHNIDFKIDLIAKDFAVQDKEKNESEKINGIVKNIVFEKLGIKTTQIISEIKSGIIKTTLEDKGRLVFEFEEDNTFGLLDDISVRIFYLNPQAKRSFTSIMGLEPKNYGSVFLYKNGFRIHPYGDEGDDWLEIEKRKGQGYARNLSNREIMGRVEVYGPQTEFKEVSSRSGGVVKSPSFIQLTRFVGTQVLRRLERYVVEGLDWDREEEKREKSDDQIKIDSTSIVLKLAVQAKNPRNIKFAKDLFNILREKEIEKMPEIPRNMERLKKLLPPSERKYLEKQEKHFRNITRTLTAERKELKQELEVKKKEAVFLSKAIAADKDQIFNLVHSISVSARAIRKGVYRINKIIGNVQGHESMIPFLDKISIENQKVYRISKIISNVNFDIEDDVLVDQNIVEYISQYLKIGLDKEVYQIDIKVINENVRFVTEFKPIEISLILDNFINNSSNAEANVFTVKFQKRGNDLHIFVGDNGKGVSKDSQKFLFTRGFTTTKSGSGLGLYYNRAMVESDPMKGSVKFVGNNISGMGKGACFELIVH